jgi:hypothetical protein
VIGPSARRPGPPELCGAIPTGRNGSGSASNVVRLETPVMIPKKTDKLPLAAPVLTPVFRYDVGGRAAPSRMQLIGIGTAVLAIAAVFVPRLLG